MKTWQMKTRDEAGNEDRINILSMADLLREVEEAVKAGDVVIEIREMRPVGSWSTPNAGI